MSLRIYNPRLVKDTPKLLFFYLEEEGAVVGVGEGEGDGAVGVGFFKNERRKSYEN